MVIWDYVVPFDFFWVWDLIIIQINNLNNDNNWEFYRFMFYKLDLLQRRKAV